MISVSELDAVFAAYWNDMERCRSAGACWSLLHVVVCIPDICAALQSDNGETSGPKYICWCDQYAHHATLSGQERYWMRCKVLHQGRASTGNPGRYTGFAFTQPAPDGQIDHLRLEGTTLVVDVGQLANEVKAAVGKWVAALGANPGGLEASNVVKHLPAMVRVRKKPMPPRPGATGSVVMNDRTS